MPELLRSAVLSNYIEIARSVGLDPYEMVRSAGLSQACLVESDLKIPALATLQLLEQSAALSGKENFGLRMAESRRLSILGQLGLLARDAPTVRQMLEILIRYMGLHNEALMLRLETSGTLSTIRQDLIIKGQLPMRQSAELSLGAIIRVLRIYMPQDWLPRRVCFVHQSPVDLSLHRHIFGPTLEFGCEFDGIVCKSSDLDTPIAASDPVMAAYARRQLEPLLKSVDRPIEREVRHLVLLLLPTGRCSIDYVARHLSLNRRTIHRQLGEQALSFSGIVNETRTELSQRYLAQTKRTLAEVAVLLGFSGLSAYSRWHRTEFGMTASAKRAELSQARKG
ncbi:MAG: AraC family transcriptional regulator ligand-binding domain-containing protein [Paucibacter sp.]|nr:AraC family transcriptional regulator ligand-binding domain-containing protein [Roseateles sp.]